MADLSHDDYTRWYGPTVGDRVRLGDTNLWVRVEDDRVGYGDEPIWGYAKNFRSRMAQFDRATTDSEFDMLIAGVVVIDARLGVLKTTIGIKDGRIAGLGRAGNPDITDGVELIIGPNTWPVNGYGLIATAGGIDSHVHLITPRLVPVALSAGVTTLITAGFEEPVYTMDKTFRAFEGLPVNLGLQASARTDVPGQVERVIEAGACGLKIHEDWGAYPEIIDATLGWADQHDVAVCLHTDGLNESCELEDTVEAIANRAVHAYHVEGAGGGHVPDLIGLVREPNIVCSSTTPTIPYGRATAAEHLEMILAVHGGWPDAPDDIEAGTERIHPATMAAEGPLHDLGAISIINSDSQGMGRIGETIRRTWQLAHTMKSWSNDETDDDNIRALRYLAKYTIEPALVHGIEGDVGSLLRAVWPMSSCGGRVTSVSSQNSSSRPDTSPGERSARATRPSSTPNRSATAVTGEPSATLLPRSRPHSSPVGPWRLGSRNAFAATGNTSPYAGQAPSSGNRWLSTAQCYPSGSIPATER